MSHLMLFDAERTCVCKSAEALKQTRKHMKMYYFENKPLS